MHSITPFSEHLGGFFKLDYSASTFFLLVHMKPATVRSRLKNGKTVIGTWLNSASPIIGESMAQCDFDFITVDAEHSAVDLTQTQHIFQAITSGNPRTENFVRIPGVDYALTKRYLDSGATGIICPLLNTKEQAELLVSACKYPPLGKRGVGFCRANAYGLHLDQNVKNANEDILLVAQIEDIEAVNNIDDILSVEGIDAVFIGPYDLTASMGITAQFDHPDYLSARDTILNACKKHGVVPGIHVVNPDPEEFIARANEGYQLIAYSLDITIVQRSCVAALESIRAKID